MLPLESALNNSGLYTVAAPTMAIGIIDLHALLNFDHADNVTHLLVSGFTGANGQDLDTDDDVVLDLTPWTAVIDTPRSSQLSLRTDSAARVRTRAPDDWRCGGDH
ncbi:MAG: hypothetical protein SGJ11_13770 [Phycisphaerae bacterium]|nr:hypothetical protein [Phycisphaerae bacterium]